MKALLPGIAVLVWGGIIFFVDIPSTRMPRWSYAALAAIVGSMLLAIGFFLGKIGKEERCRRKT